MVETSGGTATYFRGNVMQAKSTILEAIGNTPVVKLQHIVPENSADVYVKLEFINPTCSYKDRMALAMIEEAEKRGDLKAGMTVVEYTGGSTGSSLAFVCAVKGYAFVVRCLCDRKIADNARLWCRSNAGAERE